MVKMFFIILAANKKAYVFKRKKYCWKYWLLMFIAVFNSRVTAVIKCKITPFQGLRFNEYKVQTWNNIRRYITLGFKEAMLHISTFQMSSWSVNDFFKAAPSDL